MRKKKWQKSEAETKKLVPEEFHRWIKGVWKEAVGKNANKKNNGIIR